MQSAGTTPAHACRPLEFKTAKWLARPICVKRAACKTLARFKCGMQSENCQANCSRLTFKAAAVDYRRMLDVFRYARRPL